MDGIRIAKYIASAGVCSRRAAETKIEAGDVYLNDKLVATPATFVQTGDVVQVAGAVITPQVEVRVYAYHKPIGELCTEQDTDGRRTVFESLARLNVGRLVSVGRLDMNSSGLLLLTTQGALAGKLMDSNLPRTYRVRVFGELNAGHMNEAKKGLTLDGERFAPVYIKPERAAKKGEQDVKNAWYSFTLTEGKNREIRRIIEHFGGQVSKLTRVGYGPIELGDLPIGKLRELETKEIETLRGEISG